MLLIHITPFQCDHCTLDGIVNADAKKSLQSMGVSYIRLNSRVVVYSTESFPQDVFRETLESLEKGDPLLYLTTASAWNETKKRHGTLHAHNIYRSYLNPEGKCTLTSTELMNIVACRVVGSGEFSRQDVLFAQGMLW